MVRVRDLPQLGSLLRREIEALEKRADYQSKLPAL